MIDTFEKQKIINLYLMFDAKIVIGTDAAKHFSINEKKTIKYHLQSSVFFFHQALAAVLGRHSQTMR